MHRVIATPDVPATGMVGTPDLWPQAKPNVWDADCPPTAQSTTMRTGRHIRAGDLHPGDVLQQYDWSLHVRGVEAGQVSVAIAVTEFGFALHYAADEQVTLAA